MESPILRSNSRARLPRLNKPAALLVTLIGAQLLSVPALAGPVAPPGSITYIRDVPTRRAYLPGEPGDVQAVKTAPTEVIFGALGLAITPLTDDQAGAISAESGAVTSTAIGAAMDSVHSALGGPGGDSSAHFDANTIGNNMTGAVTGAIGNATAAITNTIGSVLSSLPGKP